MTNYEVYVKQLNRALPNLIKFLKKNNGGILKINLDTSKGFFIVLTDNGQYRYFQKDKLNPSLYPFFATLKDYLCFIVNDRECYEVLDENIKLSNSVVFTTRGIVLSMPLAISSFDDFLTEVLLICHHLIKTNKHFFIELAVNNKIIVNNFMTDQELLTHQELLNLPFFNSLSKQIFQLTPIIRNQSHKELKYLWKIHNLLLFASNESLLLIDQERCERLLLQANGQTKHSLIVKKELLLIPQKIDYQQIDKDKFLKNIQFLKNNGFNFNQNGDITSFAKLYQGLELNSVISFLITVSEKQQQIDWQAFSNSVVIMPHEVKPYELVNDLFQLDSKKYKSQLQDVLRVIDCIYLENLFRN